MVVIQKLITVKT
ncbi:hypothetical protein FWK35_00029219 [Aphis craccivora]|nr:hypothetical protein FWK35_00034123 [Aphis craccivora]KAF0757757.1 hypothetical protein FWK35_00033938 [Aphis craccivora]KAF0765978.1 hypothetical protein FWK35_00029219 [Aphis craccivora]